MFTSITKLQSPVPSGREHIWSITTDAPFGYLAGLILNERIIRVRLVRDNRSSLETTRYALADGGSGTLPYHSWMVARGDEQWEYKDPGAGKAETSYLEPFLYGFSYSDTELRLTHPLAQQEHIYGLGERTGNMNKRGQKFTVWNIDPPTRHFDDLPSMYTSIPFYIRLNPENGHAYGVFIDHTGRAEMDFGAEQANEASVTIQGNELIVYFFAGPAPADVIQQYTELTGHMPLPPRWAIGHHQCRWSYTSAQQVLEVAKKLRARNHPCDSIWLDIDYMNGYRNFTWNEETFPDPPLLTRQLHERGLHLATILDPGTKIDDAYAVYQEGRQKGYFCQYENGEIFEGSVWPGPSVFPDFSRAEVRSWWGNLYKGLLDAGVDAIWNDMNEPALTNFLSQLEDAPSIDGTTMDETVLHGAGGDRPDGPDGPPVLHRFFHNAYGMEMARSAYEGLSCLRPHLRPFVLTRSGTGGVQRYAAMWTGDNSSEWSHILLAIRMCLNVGMSGIPFIGADIGGFWGVSNGELLVRFAQLGVFMPFSRNHNAIGNPDQEPWAFGETYEDAYRKATETRYRFLPHLYTLLQQAATTGAPIMRPLYYHYPHDARAIENSQTEFLIGDTLLSAPIFEEGATSRDVYVPEGAWFDYWDGTRYEGKTTYTIQAPLDRWPLLVRANSILPTGPVMQYVDQMATDPLTVTCHIEPGGQASYTLYEDDGQTLDYSKGAFALTAIHCSVENDSVIVHIDEQHTAYIPRRSAYEIVVHHGDRILQQMVRAGQGSVTVKL